ncbi:MAG: ATP-binding cassette domain-containing protein, partial [Nanoarchaeota archaeon]
MSFIISNLSAKIGQTEILKDVSLTIEKGKIHVLMGKNGSGKSTLAQAIMGNPALSVEGKIELDNIDLSLLKTHERAQKGLFMSFQNPVSIPGVRLNTLLRTAYNSIKNKKLDVVEFHKLLKEKLKILNLDSSFSTRAVNEKM